MYSDNDLGCLAVCLWSTCTAKPRTNMRLSAIQVPPTFDNLRPRWEMRTRAKPGDVKRTYGFAKTVGRAVLRVRTWERRALNCLCDPNRKPGTGFGSSFRFGTTGCPHTPAAALSGTVYCRRAPLGASLSFFENTSSVKNNSNGLFRTVRTRSENRVSRDNPQTRFIASEHVSSLI